MGKVFLEFVRQRGVWNIRKNAFGGGGGGGLRTLRCYNGFGWGWGGGGRG